jgi:prepilin-type N-terminal cleavage/methylation domain-containing protein
MASTTISTVIRRTGRRAFTLVEMMISVTIGSMVLAGVMSTYLMLIRSGVAAANYVEMDAQARRAFETMANDIKMTQTLVTHVTNSVITAITLTIPSTSTSTGYTVTYGWDQTFKWFYSVPGSTVPADGTASVAGRVVLAKNITNLFFQAYQQSQTTGAIAEATSDSNAKHVQCFMTLKRSLNAAVNTETIQSAAFTLRNTQVPVIP